MKMLGFMEATVETGIDLDIAGYKLAVEPIARLGYLFIDWNAKNLGMMSEKMITLNTNKKHL